MYGLLPIVERKLYTHSRISTLSPKARVIASPEWVRVVEVVITNPYIDDKMPVMIIGRRRKAAE